MIINDIFKKVFKLLISIKILTSSTELILQTDDDMSEKLGRGVFFIEYIVHHSSLRVGVKNSRFFSLTAKITCFKYLPT